MFIEIINKYGDLTIINTEHIIKVVPAKATTYIFLAHDNNVETTESLSSLKFKLQLIKD